MNRHFAKLLLTLSVLLSVSRVGLRCGWSDELPLQGPTIVRLPAVEETLPSGELPAASGLPRWEPLPEPVQPMTSNTDDSPTLRRWFNPMAGVRIDTGDGVALREAYWTPQVFAPLWHQPGQSLLFADLRGTFVQDDLAATNVGLGWRTYNAWLDRTIGLYVYYDYRDTQRNGFHQVSPGVELLGDRWDLRGNLYFPQVGDQRQSLPNLFAGNYLYVDRAQVALTGGDLEAGWRLPQFDHVRVFGAGYYFQGPDVSDVIGVRARVQADWSEVISTNVSVQTDDSFGTSVNAWVQFRFPATRGGVRCGSTSSCDRWFEPVQRFQNVVVRDDAGSRALDPASGQPFYFLHVAASGGIQNGSFENPFSTLAQALADPRYTGGVADVIYVRQNPAVQQNPLAGLQHVGDVTLAPHTQLLSNGPVQYLATTEGLEFLPYSGSDLRLEILPQIQGTVALADDVTLSGFQVTAASAQAAIGGTNLSRVNVNHNLVANSQGAGIQLTGFHGVGNLSRNTITDFATDAIAVVDSPLFTGAINNNTISPVVPLSNPRSFNAGLGSGPFPPLPPDAPEDPVFYTLVKHGIRIQNSTYLGSVSDNVIQQFTDAEAILIQQSTFQGAIANNILFNNAAGLHIENSAFQGVIVGNRITCIASADLDVNPLGVSFDGILLKDNALFQGDIVDNVLTSNSRSGLMIFNSVQGTFVGNVTGNTMNQNGAGMMVYRTDFVGTITNNSFSNSLQSLVRGTTLPTIGDVTVENAGDGLDFIDCNILATISGNTIHGNAELGMGMWDSTFAGEIVGNQMTNNGPFDVTARDRSMGLAIVRTAFQGNIRGNTFAENGAVGLGIWDSQFVGDVANNVIQGNTDGFWLIDTPATPRDTSFVGNLQGNTIVDNLRVGAAIWNADFLGNIANNTITGNNVEGNASTFGHDVAGLALYETTVMVGNIQHNIVSQNHEIGILMENSRLIGDISYNTLSSNAGEGMQLNINGPGVWFDTVRVLDNQFSANNGGASTEFLMINQGAGTLDVTLAGNRSTNVAPLGSFNYDLQNNGGGTFNLGPVNVQSLNVGSVGSSNGSVVIP